MKPNFTARRTLWSALIARRAHKISKKEEELFYGMSKKKSRRKFRHTTEYVMEIVWVGCSIKIIGLLLGIFCPLILIILGRILSIEASFNSIPSIAFSVLIIASWLILLVDLVWIIFDIIALRCTKLEFYNDKVVEYWGVFHTHKKTTIFAGVLSVYLEQSLIARCLNFGDVYVDVQGRWDVNLNYISKARNLEKYLDQCRVLPRNMSFIAQS